MMYDKVGSSKNLICNVEFFFAVGDALQGEERRRPETFGCTRSIYLASNGGNRM